MIVIDWLCNQRRNLDFELCPVSESVYADNNFNIYKYINYYDILVDLHCTDIDSALFIANNLTSHIWHVVAQMEYLDWKDMRKNSTDFFFNSIKPIHIREEYAEKNDIKSWFMFEYKGKFYGEFEKKGEFRSNLIYLSSDYRTAKYMYEEFLALEGVKWKNEWNY